MANFCRIVLIPALASLLYVAGTSAATQVALVSPDPSAQDALALLQAQLSSDKSLQFVERSAITKVLDEQNFAVLADPNHAVTIGHILHVDLFAVLETGVDKKLSQPLGLVIYDAATGLRLTDLTLPQKGTESLVSVVGAALHTAEKKCSAPPDARKTLSVVTVRNTNLPRDRDSFCDALGLLLQHALISSPDILVLERQRLEYLNHERQLATSPANPLLASLITVDLDLARSPDGVALTGTALLTDTAGKVLTKLMVSVPMAQAATLPNRLAIEIAAAVRGAVIPAMADTKLEARRFAIEAELLLRHFQAGLALQAAEAAYALDPTDIRHEPVVNGSFAVYRPRYGRNESAG